LLYSYFEGERWNAGHVPQICDWEANTNCPQILSHRPTQEIKGKIVATTGHLEVKSCTKNLLCVGAVPGPRQGAYRPPQNP